MGRSLQIELVFRFYGKVAVLLWSYENNPAYYTVSISGVLYEPEKRKKKKNWEKIFNEKVFSLPI